MAEWKKVVVSGSAISQLNNDSNYLVSGDSVASLSGSFSGSFEGDGSGLTGISADTLANSLVDGNGIADFSFNGSAGATVSVQADGSTLSVGAAGVKVADAGITATQLNSSVAGDGLAGGAGTALSVNVDDSTIEINSDSLRVKSTFSASLDSRIASNASDISTLDAASGSFATAIAGNDSDISALQGVQAALVAETASLDSRVTAQENFSASLDATFATDADLTSLSSSAASDITSNSDSISSLETVQGALVAATSSYALSSTLTSVSSSLASDKQDKISVTDTSGQGGIDLTFSSNALSGTVVGLGQSDSPTFAGVSVTGDATISGNLTVNGTASYINTQDLFVEDRFILLNSGSADPDEGGIVIDEGGAVGHAYVYDSNNVRFGFTASLDATTAGGVTPDAFVSAVVDEAAGHSDVSEYQKNGNIRVTAGGDIYIYS